jgi:hypothetical protein
MVTCKECVYWWQTAEHDDIGKVDIGICRRHPPVNITYGPQNLLDCKWPATWGTDWCGEGADSEPENPAS